MEERIQSDEFELRALRNIIHELRGNVRVYARVRPFHLSDGVNLATAEPVVGPSNNSQRMVITNPDKRQGGPVEREQTHKFNFDKAFGPSATQDEVFAEVSEFVQSALDGYNVCLFSYGQTGSGKTYSMLGMYSMYVVNDTLLFID
jgi:kinesin family protein C1